MRTSKRIGRIVGGLVIVQMVGGALTNFVLLQPVIAPPGFLVNAAAHSLRVGICALLGIVIGAVSTGIAITALPLFRGYSETAALWFLALAIAGLSLAVVENSAVMSMLSFSQAYAKADPSDAALFESMRVLGASSRNWAHYTHLVVGGATYLVFYATVFRFALIPRALAAFGIAAVALQMIAVSMPLLGQPIVMTMILPMGLAHLALALWLAVKGFEETRQPSRIEAQPAI